MFVILFFVFSTALQNIFVDLLNMTYLNMDYVREIQLLSTFWNGLCNITSFKDHKEWEVSDVDPCFFYFIIDFFSPTGQLALLSILTYLA